MITLTRAQSAIFRQRDNFRYRVVVAGRRFGKSYYAIVETLVDALKKSNQRCWYVAPTIQQVNEIAFDYFMELAPPKSIKSTNLTTRTITFINGSRILLKGADNPKTLVGVGLDKVVLDEYAYMEKPNIWSRYIRATLADKKGSALIIGTPSSKNHLYDLFQNGLDPTKKQWRSWTYTTAEGGNVDADEIKELKADINDDIYNEQINACFDSVIGAVYKYFGKDNIFPKRELPDRLRNSNILHIGVDFNVNPLTAVIAVNDSQNNALYIVDEIYLKNSVTQELATEIKRRYPTKQIKCYPDPTGRARKTSSAIGVTDHTILRNSGFYVHVPNGNYPVNDRIQSVNTLLKNAKGERKLFVADNCKHTIRSLESLVYKRDTGLIDKNMGFDHITDALGYLVMGTYPIKKLFSSSVMISGY